jgi:hypothetical protein
MDDLVERLENWPMREEVKTYKHEFHIAETGNSYTSTHAIPVSPKAIMRQAAAEIRSLREQVAQERAEAAAMVRGMSGFLEGADYIATAIERHEDKEPRA